MTTPEAGTVLRETAASGTHSREIFLPDPAELERLTVEYTRTRDRRLRESLILYHQRLVKSIAVRFVGGGETLEDLLQVGNIGLINALDRYDPRQGTRFSTFATPTILGEIKRHFRDKTSPLKIPRWLQERYLHIERASRGLTGELGRSPTPAELANRLEISEEEVLEALEGGAAMNPLSLDASRDGFLGAENASLMDLTGHIDQALRDFELYGDLRAALAHLEARERRVIALRFFAELSQAKIAQRMNISQMHVSRLQQRALKRLRHMLAEDQARTRGYSLHR